MQERMREVLLSQKILESKYTLWNKLFLSPSNHHIRYRKYAGFSKVRNYVSTKKPYTSGDRRWLCLPAQTTVYRRDKWNIVSRYVRQTDQTNRHTGPGTIDTEWRLIAGDVETRDIAAYGLRRLVRFKIVGPLLIQADIIGGVCYLHTLVRALLVQDRIRYYKYAIRRHRMVSKALKAFWRSL